MNITHKKNVMSLCLQCEHPDIMTYSNIRNKTDIFVVFMSMFTIPTLAIISLSHFEFVSVLFISLLGNMNTILLTKQVHLPGN